MNKGKKVLAVLSTAALLGTTPAAVVAPFLTATVAYAATYEAGSPPQVSNNSNITQNIGLLKVTIDPSQLFAGNALTVRLPADFDMGLTASYTTPATLGTDTNFPGEYYLNGATTGAAGRQNVYIVVPSAANYFKGANFADQNAVQVFVTAKNELRVVFVNPSALAGDLTQDKAYFEFIFNGVKVASGFSGPINVSVEGTNGGASTNPFNSASVTIATVGSGAVSASIDSVKSITDAGGPIDVIRIKEDRPGAFASGQYIKLKLPNGFSWDVSGASLIDNNTGNPITLGNTTYTIDATQDSGRSLVLTSHTTTQNQAGYLVLTGLKINVSDSSIAKYGDVDVAISGTATSTVSDLVVASYGDYGATVSAANPTTIMSGRNGGDTAKIGNIIIQETAPGSLLPGRTIKLTLSGNARWAADPADPTGNTPVAPNIDYSQSDLQGYSLGTWQFEGVDHSTIKTTVGGSQSTTKAAKIVLKDAQVVVAAGVNNQDVTVSVSGSAGASGDAGVVAHVVSPVTASIEGNVAEVNPGAVNVELPTIVIKETQAEAIDAGKVPTPPFKQSLTPPTGTGYKELALEFFQNEVPSLPASIQVTEGDILLDTGAAYKYVTADGRWQIRIPVKSTSSKPSTIKISGIKLTLDRTTPYGPVNVAVKGDAVVQSDGVIPGSTAAATVQVANVTVPAPAKTTAVFTIGSNSFTVNGQTQTMDVAPYIKNDRTMLPVRYVALALGIPESNIIWGSDYTVTIISGTKVVKLTIGSNVMVVNGTAITMDTTPEIKNDRTFLPISWISKALNANISYDGNTGQVTVESVQQ
ncbi:MAG: copper amine oxidase N-terminal domain-containing protein [Kyrpidia sp.]|nr:copper amine oxidase N-terminal domain-containing protein [Kyrpidia sp.]